jgi:hypothetical protein
MPAPTFLSLAEFPGDGTTVNWEFNFAGGYINRSHVKALIRDEFGAPTDYVLTDDNFITPFTLSITPPVPEGHTLRIYRDTPRDAPLVNFTGGSNFTEANLDLLARQTVMCAAEAFDAGAYAEAFDLLGQAQTAASQAAAALAAAIQAEAASAISAAAAAGSQAAAAVSATQADARRASAEAARDVAITSMNTAGTFRDIAVDSALAAGASESAAGSSAATANTARADAQAARDLALSYRNTASTHATTATNAANAASGSAASAASSAAAAATFDPANYVSRATGAAQLPTWTTATRPAHGDGRVGFNTTTGRVESSVAGAWVSELTSADRGESAAIPTTSGSLVEVAGIPAWARRVTVTMDEISTNGTTDVLFQVGNGALVTSGYLGSWTDGGGGVSGDNDTGMPLRKNTTAGKLLGTITMMRLPGTDRWIISAYVRRSDIGGGMVAAARLTLAGALDRVAFRPVGAPVFNGGQFHVFWE